MEYASLVFQVISWAKRDIAWESGRRPFQLCTFLATWNDIYMQLVGRNMQQLIEIFQQLLENIAIGARIQKSWYVKTVLA